MNLNELFKETFTKNIDDIKSSKIELQNLEYLKNFINNNKPEIIETNIKPNNVVTAGNRLLLLTSYEADLIQVYDGNNSLNSKKEINLINGKRFVAESLTCSDKNIFIFDSSSGSIIKTDFEFNVIDTKNRFNNMKINNITSIYFKNDCLYASIPDEKLIMSLTPDLEYIDSLELSHRPNDICVSNKAICVNDIEYNVIYFYDVKNGNLFYKYYEHDSKVNEINSFFYEFLQYDEKILVYDSIGKLLFKLIPNEFNIGKYNSFTRIVAFNNGFIINDLCSDDDGNVGLLKKYYFI